MSNTEILEVLRSMLKEYEQCVQTQIVKQRCDTGFCLLLDIYELEGVINWAQRLMIMDELRNDLTNPGPKWFFYPVFKRTFNFEVSIQPRIDHLKRTIVRLQSEQRQHDSLNP